MVINTENNSEELKYIEAFLNDIKLGSLYISKIISFLSSLNSNLCKLFPFISSNTFKHWGISTFIASNSTSFPLQLITMPISFSYL